MSNNLNITHLSGRLTHDPEISYTPTGNGVCRFSVVTNHSKKAKDDTFKEVATYHRCVTFGKQAETFHRFMKRGKPVIITGRYVNNDYTDGNQQRVKTMQLEVLSFEFVGSSNDEAKPKPKVEYHQKGAPTEKVEPYFEKSDFDGEPYDPETPAF